MENGQNLARNVMRTPDDFANVARNRSFKPWNKMIACISRKSCLFELEPQYKRKGISFFLSLLQYHIPAHHKKLFFFPLLFLLRK